MSDERGIRCPQCGCRHFVEAKLGVTRTNALGPKESIWRVRVCERCGRKFPTVERVMGQPAG